MRAGYTRLVRVPAMLSADDGLPSTTDDSCTTKTQWYTMSYNHNIARLKFVVADVMSEWIMGRYDAIVQSSASEQFSLKHVTHKVKTGR